RAVHEGAPCELTGNELTESMIIAGIRSAVCAPISVGGRAVACLYAAHGGVAGLFGEDEKRIAGYISTLAGASLERARSDTNLRRLHETQDQLVEASKMAATGTLVAGLSHELNNPIAVILGRAQTALRQMEADNPYRSGMTAIERQARRCRDLV